MVGVVPRDAHGAVLGVGDVVGAAVAVGVAVGLAEALAVGRGFGLWLWVGFGFWFWVRLGSWLWARANGKRLQAMPVTRSVTTTTESTTFRLFTITPLMRRMTSVESDANPIRLGKPYPSRREIASPDSYKVPIFRKELF
jgi:hypothetical protein